MDGVSFEGYAGIGWGDGLLIHDILVCAIIVLLSIFAYAFHNCYPLFEKMTRGLISLKERQNLFDTPTRESVFFNFFMRFQTLFLSAVILFLIFCRISGIQEQRVQQAIILQSGFFLLLILFYLLKRFLYYLYSRVFISKSKFNLWNTTYHTLFYYFGILLYIPILWLFFVHDHFVGAQICFIAIYVLFRATVIYVKIRLFYDKNNGFLFLMLYLCAQEIVPLLFLYESLSYLHNVIE